MPHEKCFVKWQNETTLKIYKLFTWGYFYVGEKNNVYVGLRLDEKTVEKFRALAKAEDRDLSQQMERIIKEWFAAREKPPAPKVYGPGEYPPVGEETGDTIILFTKNLHGPP